MIPTIEVADHAQDWRSATLARITFAEWQDGSFTATQGYSPLSPLEWEVAAEVVAEQSQTLSRLDAVASTPEEFEELAREAEDDTWDELGSGGLVCALSAAGFWTFTGCRGHFERGDWDVPFVGVVAERAHLEALEPLVLRAGCAFLVREDGLVDTFADRVTALNELALLVIEHRADFDAPGQVRFADD